MRILLPVSQHNKIAIYGPKADGYVVEFRMGADA
jgi:hypothetical protein